MSGLSESDLDGYNIRELREIGRGVGVKGVTTHSKAVLLELVREKMREQAGGAGVKRRKSTPKAVKVVETVEDVGVVEVEEKIEVVAAEEKVEVAEVVEPAAVEEKAESAAVPLPVATPLPVAAPVARAYTPHTPRPPRDNSYLTELDSGIERAGVLEMHPEGYGFLRTRNYLTSPEDVYVSPSLVRRFALRTGDLIRGNLRKHKEGEKFRSLLIVTSINGDSAIYRRRPHFENLVPIYPDRRITLENNSRDIATRLIDLTAPIGFGQRGIIVAPPKAGKTVLIKKIARAILENHEDVQLIVLLIDERPEEVTDMERSIAGERADVISSTFDEQPERHKRVTEIVLERAKRGVEQGKNMVILLDSLTRMSRAYNLTMPAGGRLLSGGLDSGALYMPKKFFGAARNIENGGSLTILATALIDTGSKMDDVVYEEFKGTGNMELVLDRRLSEKRIFPAININQSGTRREETLLSQKEYDALFSLRRRMSNMSAQEFNEQFTDMLTRTNNNAAFVDFVLNQIK